jgi:tetraacyldisaccharide 4'-kinase
MREMLFPFSWAYQGITGVRNWLYDHSLRRSTQVPAKVISVGNLTVGGTGKTPVTLALLELMKKRGYKSGVVSRGYGRGSKGVHAVDGSSASALTFGDEPALIKSLNPDIPVVVGEKRAAAARFLLNDHKVDFIFCDDAFQHRSLHRDLNLLLLDAREAQRNYRVLPVGLARESLKGALKRVDFFVITKSNLVAEEELTALLAWLKEKSDKPVLLADYVFNGLRSLKGATQKSLLEPAYLGSGVGTPDAVERTIEGLISTVKHKIFPDHHRYTDLEIEAILDEASQMGARWILTTAKDATKLKQFLRLQERLWVIDLGIEFRGDTAAFYETVDRLAGTGN